MTSIQIRRKDCFTVLCVSYYSVDALDDELVLTLVLAVGM